MIEVSKKTELTGGAGQPGGAGQLGRAERSGQAEQRGPISGRLAVIGKAEDLTGHVFGHLTALYRTENKRGRTCWMCRCDCGREKAVTAQDLKAGKVKSCGCHTHDHDHNRIDLTGRRFGRLTVVEPTGRRNSKGSVYWRCICDCGGEAEYTEDMLVHGRYLSCGCLKKAFEVLENKDVVFGKTTDGGYYLVGMKKPYRAAFALDSYGHGKVLKETIQDLQREKITVGYTETLADMDTVSDLQGYRERMRKDPKKKRSSTGKYLAKISWISVIVPV